MYGIVTQENKGVSKFVSSYTVAYEDDSGHLLNVTDGSGSAVVSIYVFTYTFQTVKIYK